MAISRSTGLPGLPNRGAPPFLGACGFPAAGGFTAPPGRATLRGGGGALAGLGPAVWAHIPTAAISSAIPTAWQRRFIRLELRVRAIGTDVPAELVQHLHRVQRPLHLFRLHEDCKAGLIHYLFHLRLRELNAATGPQLRSRNVISFGHTSNSKVHTNARV